MIGVGIFVVVAIVSLVTGNATLVALPIIPVALIVTRITRPPTYRLQRALKRLRREFASLSPPIVETTVEAWTSDVLYVTLVCGTDAEVPVLDAQLPELRRRISREALGQGIAADLVNTLRLRSVSRQAVDREGGWFAFHHNVAWPRSKEF